MPRAELVYQGSHARVVRVTLGSARVNVGWVDQWTWTPQAGQAYVLHAAYVMGTYEVSLFAEGSDAWPVLRFHMPSVSSSRDQVRDVVRYLMRWAADGGIPVPPDGPVGRTRWDTAIRLARLQVERWGTLADVEQEGAAR